MIPLKDDIPGRRFPLVTVLLIAAAATALLLAGDRLGDHAGVAVLAVDGLFLWLFGPSVEDAMGRARFAAFVILGGAAAAVVDPSYAAGGAVAAVLSGYALLYPRAHVVALGLVPGLMSVFQLPALAVLVLWVPLEVLAAGPGLAPAAGAGVGLLTVRLLAHRAQRDYQRPRQAPAY